MVLAVAPSLGSEPSCLPGEKIKLRLSYGGSFILEDNGKWTYKGGKSHLESLPVSFKYGDVAFRWTEKVKGDLTGLKYQLPGEELEPDALISVSDDNDLHEMFEEYYRGLNLPGTPSKAFRLRVFLFFDMIQEPLTPDEYADGCAFFRTASGHQVRKQLPSNGEWDASSFGSNASLDSAGTAALRRNEQEEIAAKEVEAMHWEEQDWRETIVESLNRAVNTTYPYPVPHKLSDSAFAASQLSDPSTVTGQSDGQRAYVYRTQDPWYVSPEDGAAGALVTLNTVTSKMPKGGSLSAYATPVTSSRDHHMQQRSPVLPSHISVFGYDEPNEVESLGGDGGIKLPSHISAFGDGEDVDSAYLLKQLNGQAHLAGPGQPQIVNSGIFLANAAPGAPLAVSQPMVVSYENGAMLLAGSMPLERASSGANIAANIMHNNVHRIAKDDVKVLGRIGEGAFGEVSLATCAIFGKVAVKWLKPGKVAAHSASFWREADMLANLNHPNVLRFYGAVVAGADDPSVVGIMTEYMRGGSLSQFLLTQRSFIPLRTRAELALNAVNGMAYLHEMKIVHFDLKPDNLLLDGPIILGRPDLPAPSLKVADFGLSKHKWSAYVSGVRDLRGTLPYMAPELVSDPDHVSEKADVWSLGMVLWEMLTLQTPFQQLSPQQIIAGLMVGNLAPEVPGWCEPEWRGLMDACWEPNPSSRPSFRDLATQLEKIIEAAPYSHSIL